MRRPFARLRDPQRPVLHSRVLALCLGCLTLGSVFLTACSVTASTNTSGTAPTATTAGTPPVEGTGDAQTPTPTSGPSGGGSTPTATPTPHIILPPPVVFISDFIVTATSANSSGDETDIDAAATNNNPNAILIVTANWNPSGSSGVYDNHTLGVYYHNNKWAIFHEDKSGFTPNAKYNVRVLTAGSRAFTVKATSANSTGDYTDIDSTATNNNPNAILLVTPLWRSTSVFLQGIYDPHPLGVYYHSGKWAIFHEDLAGWTNGALYNVQVLDAGAKAFQVKATASNSGGDSTRIDNAACNGNAGALVFVTAVWNPGGAVGVYDSHILGVWYNTLFGTNKWNVFHQDKTAYVANASFNISVT